MIDRILENWLDNASERSFQVPFCYLLMQQNKIVLHLTRHNAMEHGKDIIAVDAKGQLHVYQLKSVHGGKLKLSQWQEMLGQLMQLLTTPVTHPSANNDKHHLSYLVLNGEIEEEVFNAIQAYNQDWIAKKFPQYALHTIVRGQILQWALELKDQFIPTEFDDFKSLLEFFLDGGKGMLDKGKFSRLLHSIYAKVPDSAAAQKRLVSSGALLCSLALSAYQESNNHVAVIEGWTIYIAEILHFATQQQLTPRVYSNEIDIAEIIIQHASADLLEEALPMRDLFQGGLLEDIHMFRHRTTLVLGYLACYGIRLAVFDPADERITAIRMVIEKYLPDVAVWGEAAVPHLISIYWFLKKVGLPQLGIQWLMNILTMLLLVPKIPTFAFTNYYLSAEETLLLMNDANTKQDDISQAVHTGHVAETIVHLLVLNHQKTTLQTYWKGICDFIYLDFTFVRAEDIFTWRSAEGTEGTRHQQPKIDWNELVQHARTVDTARIPELLQNHFTFIPQFITVFVHRSGRNLMIWTEQQFFGS